MTLEFVRQNTYYGTQASKARIETKTTSEVNIGRALAI